LLLEGGLDCKDGFGGKPTPMPPLINGHGVSVGQPCNRVDAAEGIDNVGHGLKRRVHAALLNGRFDIASREIFFKMSYSVLDRDLTLCHRLMVANKDEPR
jgi:hypothetical protein